MKVKKIGVDNWGRKVFQNTKTKRLYKQIDHSLGDFPNPWFFTTDRFDGEPDCPIKKNIEIEII